MTWLRIDDGFADHPKIVGLTDKAFRAHVRGLCYASRHLTDGNFTKAVAVTFGNAKTLSELVDAGLWKPTTAGYAIHGYLDWNPAKADVTAKRETLAKSRSEAGRRGATVTNLKRWGTA